jgi:3-oxoacyl-[acyl-carrier protein] reductase
MSFANKVIIVTGSNRGIGKAIAFELAKQGAWVVLNGRNETRLMAALNEIQGQCPKTIAIPADVSSRWTDITYLFIQNHVLKFTNDDYIP